MEETEFAGGQSGHGQNLHVKDTDTEEPNIEFHPWRCSWTHADVVSLDVFSQVVRFPWASSFRS
jgi:hypothetical protein